ncbi:uncharacterized protein LOC120358322 isoform X2 [Solenopsis invicta]|uniref:uncharacterized protein LOC120358322 isoform X2 n=1 Tax=Solenopsis invicta TaxID=13686 RepID=UPI000E33EED7|nr:uncharacterized protein LOC120358322 isoform X2 [Solenopsis invicta]
MWHATFFLRLWRRWLQENNYSIDKNVITSNAYTSIELNAHGLLILIEKLRENNQFTPWLCSSQPCEKIFRQIKSMTSTFSTITNFNLLSILRHLNRVQLLNDISTDLSDTFLFPREENNRLGISSDRTLNSDEIPSTKKILHILDTAKNDALNIAIKLEMNMNEDIIKESFEEINIRHLIDEEENEEEEENNDDIIEQQNEDIVSASEDFGNFEDLENLPNDILIFKN